MKNLLILLALNISVSSFAQTLPELINQMSAMEKEQSRWNDQKYLTVSGQAIALWEVAGNEEKTRFADKLFLTHFRRSGIFATEGDWAQAAVELKKEGQTQKMFGGRLEFSTKAPDLFFRELAEKQVQLEAKTGTDPLAGMVDYLFEKNGRQYMVARQELDPEVNGVTIDGVSESESLVQVHYLEARGGNVTFEKTRWFIGPKGRVADTLSHATREVLQDQYGRYEPKPLQGPVSSIPTSSKASSMPTAAQPSATVVASSSPSTPRPSATTTSTTAAEKTGTTGFPIVPVVILLAVIAGAAVFFLRRKP